MSWDGLNLIGRTYHALKNTVILKSRFLQIPQSLRSCMQWIVASAASVVKCFSLIDARSGCFHVVIIWVRWLFLSKYPLWERMTVCHLVEPWFLERREMMRKYCIANEHIYLSQVFQHIYWCLLVRDFMWVIIIFFGALPTSLSFKKLPSLNLHPSDLMMILVFIHSLFHDRSWIFLVPLLQNIPIFRNA